MLFVTLVYCFVACLIVFFRKGVNSFSLPFFLTNFLCLILYIMPIYTLPWDVDPNVIPIVCVGILGMNLGHFANLKAEVRWTRKYSLVEERGHEQRNRERSFAYKALLLGVLAYGILYATRGIPVLSSNVDAARVQFLSGSGYISVPATTLIVISTLVIYITSSLKRWLGVTVAVLAFLFLSGWRGYIIFTVFPVIILMACKEKIRPIHALIGVAALFIIALMGILRAVLSSGSIYGLEINSSEFSVLEAVFIYLNFRLGEHYVGLQHVITHFQGKPLMGTGALMDLSAIFPLYSESLAKMMARLYATWDDGGGMTITMLGGFFADFNEVGVLAMSAAAAWLYSRLYTLFLKKACMNGIDVIMSGLLSMFWALAFMGTFFAQFVYYLIIYCIVYGGYRYVRSRVR